jgi:hypothetical protein
MESLEFGSGGFTTTMEQSGKVLALLKIFFKTLRTGIVEQIYAPSYLEGGGRR